MGPHTLAVRHDQHRGAPLPVADFADELAVVGLGLPLVDRARQQLQGLQPAALPADIEREAEQVLRPDRRGRSAHSRAFAAQVGESLHSGIAVPAVLGRLPAERQHPGVSVLNAADQRLGQRYTLG